MLLTWLGEKRGNEIRGPYDFVWGLLFVHLQANTLALVLFFKMM